MSDEPDNLPPQDPLPPSSPLEPHRGTMILVFGILSLLICFPLGLVAFLMGKGDLEKMKKGTMDPTGESHTNIGRILGIVGFVLGLIGTIIAFLVLPAMLAAGAAAGAAQDGAFFLY